MSWLVVTSRGREGGFVGYQPGVYVPLKALFLVDHVLMSAVV